MLPAPLHVAIYARYSSDLQNPSSVDDQVALCHQLIDKNFSKPSSILTFKDAAISGATMERPGFRRLLHAAAEGKISLVVAEGLDRLSRNLRDIAEIYEIFTYYNVSIWTGHEGRISELHVGVKGAMNALFLKDMKEKVRRGQKARVLAGFSSSSCAYGYRVVRGVVDERGRPINGVREIKADEAAIVRRIFEEYVNGQTLPQIVAGLNEDNVPTPGGMCWKRTALIGSPKKREGILLNEVYIGNLIYNRTRISRDPVTGKRRYVMNPETEWTRTHVSDLRILDDETWEKAQKLFKARHVEKNLNIPKIKEKLPKILNSHNQHALTGWVKCGWCGGQKSLASNTRYVCSTWRYARRCKNSRGTKEAILLAALFASLRKRIELGPPFKGMLVRVYEKETAIALVLRKEEESLNNKIQTLIGLFERGVDREHITERILRIQDRLHEIRQEIKISNERSVPEEPVIVSTLLDSIYDIEHNASIEEQRIVFGFLLKKITTTPIPEQRSGETVVVTLREEGWPDFWRMITADNALR